MSCAQERAGGGDGAGLLAGRCSAKGWHRVSRPSSLQQPRLDVAFLHVVGLWLHSSYSSNEQAVKVGR